MKRETMQVYCRFPSILALILALLALVLGGAAAQSSSYKPEPTTEQLLELRQLLISAGYEDVNKAMAAGYEKFGGCMSSPQGAQGVHFTNGRLIGNATLDALKPQILMYEPRPDGSMKLVGVEYLVFQKAWHDAGNKAVPVLFGQEFGLNTTLLDQPFYLLHVWLFQYNPRGLFSNWNPLVVCSDSSPHHHQPPSPYPPSPYQPVIAHGAAATSSVELSRE